jgi:hypothetical protein
MLRWFTSYSQIRYAIVLPSITAWTMEETIAHYDGRGACETEIQADKGGLELEQRRKKRRAAQEALVLLTDIAHNLLGSVPQWMFPDEPLAAFGTTHLVEDIFQLHGRLFFHHRQLDRSALEPDPSPYRGSSRRPGATIEPLRQPLITASVGYLSW